MAHSSAAAFSRSTRCMRGRMWPAPRSWRSATAIPERLKIVGDQFGIERRYSDAAQMFADGGFDFVDIATTVQSHRALVEMAAAHGVPVICQKPFAKTLDDAKAMVKVCADADCR
jgi:predicted dehydrogenase